MRPLLAALVLAALLASASAGQDDAQLLEPFEPLQLFNACRPMVLTVEALDDDAANIGLTEKTLQAAAVSRLRVACLYMEDGT